MAGHSPYFYTFRLNTTNGETLCISNREPAFDHESTHTRYYTALLVTVLIVPLVAVCIQLFRERFSEKKKKKKKKKKNIKVYATRPKGVLRIH